MVPRPMLPLLLLALWTSSALMGSRAHAQEINAESQNPSDIFEGSRTNALETNVVAERINANKHETHGPMSEHIALLTQRSPCDVTFDDSPDGNGYYRCPSSCTAWTGSAYPLQDKVVGTFTYAANSSVCLSALHAGEIQPGEQKYVSAKSHPVNTSFVATIRNRVVSSALTVRPGNNVFGYTITPSTPKAAEETDLSQSELIMVHNNNLQYYYSLHSSSYNIPLALACLPNTRGGSLHDNRFHRWKYVVIDLFDRAVQLLEQTASSVQVKVHHALNSRVLRCLGHAPALDVTGIFGRSNDGNSATRPTVTASIGGRATIRYATNVQDLGRLPDSESVPSQIDNVQLQHAGLYRSVVNKDTNYYSRLIVRACPAHRYGTNCASWCPDCLNDGECDAATGRCVCAPGTKGRHCENYCSNNQYGAECHLTCSQSTLRWLAISSTSCSGLTFCVRDPKGCSCLPGYKPPTCDNLCSRSHYGPDCTQQCNYCYSGDCDRMSGRCNNGCKDPLLCSASHLPFNLPRLRTPPIVTGCSNTRCFVSMETWNMDSHDGELVEGNVVTGYELQLRDEQNQSDWITAGSIYSKQNDVAYDFIPGRLYSFRGRVWTSVGTADPEYNLRLRETVVRIPCLRSYVGFKLIVKEITQDSFLITGMNDANCSPSLQYHLLIKEWDTSKTLLDIRSSSTAQRVTSLSQNTTYAVVLDSTTKIVTTPPRAPYPPENITIDAISGSTASAKWSRAEGAERYNITLQFVRNESCTVGLRGPTLLFNTTDEQRYLTDLNPYQRYEFCVMAANAGGQSTHRCEEFVTRALQAPAITLSDLTCAPHQRQPTCSVNAPDDCDLLNGPEPTIVWELSGGPACNSSLEEHRVSNATYKPGKPWTSFSGLYSMANYTVEVYVRNNVGRGHSGLKEVFQTLPANAPGPVQQLAVTSTATSVVLRWSPPCPPLAPVSSYEVAVDSTGYGRYTDVSLPLCPGQQDHFCYTKNNLSPNMQYRIRVRSCALKRQCSPVVTTHRLAPGAPLIKMTGRETNAVSVNFTAPPHLGTGASCYLTVINEGKTLKNFTQIEELAANAVSPYTVAGLAPSSLLLLTSRCCNKVGCSATVTLPASTLLAPLEAEAPLRAEDITNTNATLLLPKIRAGNANISLVVLVQNITGKADSEPANFTAHYKTWKKDQRSPGRKRRSATNQHCSDPSPSVYVAGTVEQSQQMFVLGSGEEINCKLTAGNSYRVAVVAEAVLLDQVGASEFPLPGIMVAGDVPGLNSGATLGIIVAILVILVITIALLVKMKQRQHKPNGPEPTSGEALPAAALPMPGQSPNRSQALIVNPTLGSAYYSQSTAAAMTVSLPADTIYQDVAEDDPIYESVSAIPVHNIEACLNQIIISPSLNNDFMLIPMNYPKSMSDGELPQNKRKNRDGSILPYNHNRVRLSIMNDDPHSDYINASHVQGVTRAKHYIAAQGPKDSDDCTIPDFWRMVVENNVDVIIMVANFVENNVVKVGTYFSSQGPIALEPFGGRVRVVSQNITPHFTISVVQVTLVLHGFTETRQVTHYHYTKWPDHEVPREIHTLSQMLHQIANSHHTMCALVHSSLGIGRTGTVIFDLLCYDHLVETQKLDIMAVVVHLRKSRASLVENQMQIELGVQLLDEILFAFLNVTPTSNMQSSMPQLLAECQTLFSHLNGLPSPLEYKTGARGENVALNRSPGILPADSRMISFQNHSGQSQYINAVSLDSHSEADAYIITEHPLKSTLESFWEMVKQKTALIVVVLNNSIDEVYPQMFAEEVDGQMKFGSTVVTTTNVHRVCSNLIERDINVEAGLLQHSVVLYEVEGWPRGAAVPPDHTVLTRLVNVILGGSLTSAYPPVLVCSDGVTACGLMAGTLRVVERMKLCQDVDIYRTAVMLRRCRQEFVVDHIQLQVMLRVAVDYLSTFRDYEN